MYRLQLTKEAEKNISRLPKSEVKKIFKKLHILKINPYLGKKLNGELENYYSLRAWPYRILYQINNNELIIYIYRIAHRQGVYK